MTHDTTETMQSAGESAFLALGLNAALVAAVSSLGYEEPTDIQREAIPPLIAGQRRARPGRDRHGQDRRVRPADPAPHRRVGRRRPGRSRPDSRSDARAGDAGCRGGAPLWTSARRRAYCRSTVASRCSSSCARSSAASTSSSRRRDVRSITSVVARSRSIPSRWSCSTKPTRCSTWASRKISRQFSTRFRDERQTALFSATMAAPIRAIASRHLREPVLVTIAREVVAPGEAPRVREVAFVVQRRHKVAALARVLDMEDPTSAIVFCRTRTEVDELTETLGGRGYRAEALHGGLSQEQRDRVMRRFRDGTSELLVATDVAARGLDIEHVSHVVNFDVPSSPDAYVHRIGRTGRAGREGVAITLAEAREHRLLRNIEQVTKRKIKIESVPTVHDLRARRLELTRASLEEVLVGGDLDSYRVVDRIPRRRVRRRRYRRRRHQAGRQRRR